MELMILVFLLVVIFTLWGTHSRLGRVGDDIDRLQKRVEDLEIRFADEPWNEPANKFAQTPLQTPVQNPAHDSAQDHAPKTALASSVPQVKIEESVFARAAEEAEGWVTMDGAETSVPETPRSTQKSQGANNQRAKKSHGMFEHNIAAQFPVWIGAVSLICAAFFLVKYSIELGWMKPMVRVSLGGFFGGALLAAGQWVGRREQIANSVRIAQGLVGAGLVALYVSIYAAINLYSLMPPLLGFGGMAAVTSLAVLLSLRHGQPIAVFGLLGGLLTPALIGSDDPNALAMFGYLFLLFSGMFAVLVRKGWWRMAIAAVIGVFCWSVFWFLAAFAASDAMVLVLFAMAVMAVVLGVTGKRVIKDTMTEQEELSVHGLNFTAIAGGVLTIIWLSFEMTLSLFDWSMLGLLSMAVMVLAYFQPAVYQKVLWLKLATSLILFFAWAQDAPLGNAVAVLAGMGVIYIGGGAFVMRQIRDPRFWAGMQVVAALGLYTISYYVLDLPQAVLESFGMFWGLISLVLASLSIYQASDIREKYSADPRIREHLVAIYALAASAFLSLGLAIELPWRYVPLAIAGQIAATAWVYYATQIDALKKIMLILTTVFAALNYPQIVLFAGVIIESLWGGVPSVRPVGFYGLDAPLVKLGVPSVLLFVALWVTMKRDSRDKTLNHMLFGTALALALACAYCVFRGLVHADQNFFAVRAGFIERGVISFACAGAGFAMLQMVRRYDVSFLKPGGLGLFHLGMLRFAYFDYLVYNPYWSKSQFVGDMPVLNGITLTYGLGTLLAAWAVYSKEQPMMKRFYKVLCFISLFAFVTLSVRQYFHEGYVVRSIMMSSAEFYAYSVVWLMTGLGLLGAGIKMANKPLRRVSLAFVIFAVCKVFLFDASELEGLYRVFSFFGLGVSLIGLSYFYTKFVLSNQHREDEG